MNSISAAFLFDSEHPKLGSCYGSPCTKVVLNTILTNVYNIYSGLFVGDIILEPLAYNLSEVSRYKDNRGYKIESTTERPDMKLYKLLLCDFADSISCDWNTINIINLRNKLFKNRIWVVSLNSIDLDFAIDIHKNIFDFEPYIGATKIDTGNPLHIQAFTLVNKLFIKNNTPYFKFDPQTDINPEVEIETYAPVVSPIFLDNEEYLRNCPSNINKTKLSERGKLSSKRLNLKNKLSYEQVLTKEVYEFIKINKDIEEISYSSSLQFNCEVEIDPRKFTDYLLNLEHEHGKSKAKFFAEVLHIYRDDYRFIIDQIRQVVKHSLIYKIKNSVHGISHGAIINIIGRNGRSAFIETCWLLNTGNIPRFITAYPFDKNSDIQLNTPIPRIPPKNFNEYDKYEYIYNVANTLGMISANNCIPTPLVIKDHHTIFEGLQGYVYITVFDARKGFAKWLKINCIGNKNYRLGWDISIELAPNKDIEWTCTSIEPQEEYANEFCNVLEANDIKYKITKHYT